MWRRLCQSCEFIVKIIWIECKDGKISILLQPNGDKVPLDDFNGIDMLGNMMESSIVSIDRDYYGDIHNMGHIFMAFAHDPEHQHLESFGVLGKRTTWDRLDEIALSSS